MSSTTNLLLFSFALYSVVSTSSSEDHSLDTCLRKDSISCVQIHVYKKLRSILSQHRIDLPGGFEIVKEKLEESGKSLPEGNNSIDGQIYDTIQVSDRQLLLEDFIYNKVINFFKNRRIEWSLGAAVQEIAPMARKIFSSIPGNVKDKLIHYVAEGRGKKKFMRLVVPVIIAFKMTVFTWVKVIYLGIALIAKKALIMSMIALIIAIFVALKKHSYKEYRQPYYEIKGETIHSVPYYPVGWSSGGHSNHESYDLHGSQSSPAHYLAYSAQKPNYT